MSNNFVNRLFGVIRISFVSSTAFATFFAAATTLVVTPLFGVLYDILFGQDIAATDYARIGYGAALVCLCVSIQSGMVAKTVTDRTLGVFIEIHTRRTIDFAYWIGIAIVPLVLSTITAAVTIGGVFFLTPGHNIEMLATVLKLCPATMIIGVLLGMCCSGFGISLPDPYLGDTIVSALLPLSAGVIVPVSLYPEWLRTFFLMFPMTRTVMSFTQPNGIQLIAVLSDLLVSALWAMAGIMFVSFSVKRLRSGIRRDPI